MFKKIFVFVVTFLFVSISSILGQGGAFPVDPNAANVPIDDGLPFLLLLGVVYGIRKVYAYRKQRPQG